MVNRGSAQVDPAARRRALHSTRPGAGLVLPLPEVEALVHEPQSLEFLDVRDEHGHPARYGVGFAEGGDVVVQQTAHVVHLSPDQAVKTLGLLTTAAAGARGFRP